MIRVIAVFLTLALVSSYLIRLSFTTVEQSIGQEIYRYENMIATITLENQILEDRLASSSALWTALKKANENGFTQRAADHLLYLP